MTEYSSSRYLRSKSSVDDRALNRQVLSQLEAELTRRAKTNDTPPKVLEIGCGVGNMLSRLLRWGLLADAVYTFVEIDADSLAEARESISRAEGASVTPEGVHLVHPRGSVEVRFVNGSILDFARELDNSQQYDLVIGNAVLDLFDVKPALHDIWRCMQPGSLFWFSINFDGDTIFVPDAEYDDAVMRAYHRTMDDRIIDGRPSGDSRSGRHLLNLLPETGAELLAAGGSDWVVFPRGGSYPADEQYFVRHILHTIETALVGDPELNPNQLRRWLDQRFDQLERGQLCYVAHQLDMAGRTPT